MDLEISRPLYICNPNLVETEYLRREYSLRATCINPVNFENFDDLVLIACTDPTKWEAFLRNRPIQSVIFFLLGNESYDRKTYEYFNFFPSIRHVFIYNPPREGSKTGFMNLISLLLDRPSSLIDKNLLFALIYAGRKRLESIGASMDYSWSNLPLGYTNDFIRQVVDLGLADSSSSISSMIPNSYTNTSTFREQHTRKMVFRGQIGTWFRKIIIDYFEEDSRFQFSRNSGWTGEKSHNYVLEIQAADFVLCPPGVITNQTFRYYESVFLQKIPVASVNTVQDFHFCDYWSQVLPLRTRHSHISIYKHLQRASPTQLHQYITIALRIAQNEIDSVNVKLNSLCSKVE